MLFRSPSSDRPARFLEEGFRVEPEFRQASGSPEGYPESDVEAEDPYAAFATPLAGSPAPSTVPRAVTAAELDGVFDDPGHGEPGRDRFAVHVAWEIVLLVAAAAMALQLNHSQSGSLSGVNLRTLMVSATIFAP